MRAKCEEDVAGRDWRGRNEAGRAGHAERRDQNRETRSTRLTRIYNEYLFGRGGRRVGRQLGHDARQGAILRFQALVLRLEFLQLLAFFHDFWFKHKRQSINID